MPPGIYQRPSVTELLLNNFEVTDSGCWLWTGTIEYNSYGRLHLANGQKLVHILSFEIFKGKIGQGLIIDHTCHNQDEQCKGGWFCIHRRCINPDHLDAVTQKQNICNGKGLCANNARKTMCDSGHVFDLFNTYIAKNGSRHCRECWRIKHIVYRAKASLMEFSGQ
jgi:hypothetical protein